MEQKKTKILIVDDEQIIRDFFKRFLSMMGIDVVDVDSGYKAIELAKVSKFDLFFVDVRMPGINGLETFRALRQIDPAAAVVMITGYTVDDILDQALKEGAKDIIHKPFDISKIRESINDLKGERKPDSDLNILVVDDEESILIFFSRFFKDKNIKHSVARNKKEAEALIKKERFDLVFLDLLLGKEKGMDIYKEIKEISSETEVVIITAFPDKIKELGVGSELAGCLYKPFEIESICKHINEAKLKSASINS
jgi:two-component system, NtrC family, response regulator HydG